LHPEGDQIITQRQDRPSRRVDLPHPRRAPSFDGGVGPTDAHHPRRLGHVDRRGTSQDPFGLVAFDLLDIVHARLQEHLQGSLADGTSEPGALEGYESLIGVLVAQCVALLVGPHTKLNYGLENQEHDGVTGSLHTIFTLASRPRSGHRN